MIQVSYENSLNLLDFVLEQSIYIHSNGVPLGSFDSAYENLHRILKLFGIAYKEIGTSGHAPAEHILYSIHEINPPVLIPLHSFHPERIQAKDGKQFLPEYVMQGSTIRSLV